MDFLKGRTNRAMYWVGVTTLVVLMLIARLVFHFDGSISEVVVVFLCIPRLHDMGLSGWHVLWGIGLEILAVAIGLYLGSAEAILMAGGIAVFAIGIAMIVLGAVPGQRDPNRFGDPPAPGFGRKPKADT